jgi:hypothetical protein
MDVADPFSPQAQRLLGAAMVALLLTVFALGLVVLAAPLTVAVVPLGLAALVMLAVRGDLRHVRRHGWWRPGEDDGSSDGGLCQPNLPRPPGDGDQPELDWDSFQRELWEHIEAQTLASRR